jgi:hypothetical protein
MKRIFTLSSVAFLAAILFSACYKQNILNDESYWLSKERGEVVYSDTYCNYYVVQTYNGYTIVRAYGGYKPFEGSIVYGDFSYSGMQDIYNRSTGVVFTGNVTDYWLTYTQAQNAIDYYCPLGLTSQGKVMTDSKSNFRKTNP